MVTTEQDEAADETRSSYDEICSRTSTEETSTSWSRLEQRKKMLEEFDKLEIDVSLSRKEAAQHGQWRCQRLASVTEHYFDYYYYYYIRQGGYVFVLVCLSVCLLAILRKNVQTDLHEIFRDGWR